MDRRDLYVAGDWPRQGATAGSSGVELDRMFCGSTGTQAHNFGSVLSFDGVRSQTLTLGAHERGRIG